MDFYDKPPEVFFSKPNKGAEWNSSSTNGGMKHFPCFGRFNKNDDFPSYIQHMHEYAAHVTFRVWGIPSPTCFPAASLVGLEEMEKNKAFSGLVGYFLVLLVNLMNLYIYPPVNKHSNGNSPSWIGNTSSNGGFSIAMLVYRRVYTYIFSDLLQGAMSDSVWLLIIQQTAILFRLFRAENLQKCQWQSLAQYQCWSKGIGPTWWEKKRASWLAEAACHRLLSKWQPAFCYQWGLFAPPAHLISLGQDGMAINAPGN